MINDTEITVVADELFFPESPRIHDGRLWFSDGIRACSLIPGEVPRVEAEFDCPLVLGTAFLSDGRVLTSDAFGRRVLAYGDAAEPTVFADLSEFTTNPLNEVVVTDTGTVLVSDMGFNMVAGEEPASASMICIHPDGRLQRTGPQFVFPNGTQLVNDGHELLVANGLGTRVTSVAVRDDGTLADEGRDIGDFSSFNGHADGISVTTDGTIFFGDPEAGRLVRVVDGDELADSIRVPGYNHVTACLADETTRTVYATVCSEMPFGEFHGLGAIVSLEF